LEKEKDTVDKAAPFSTEENDEYFEEEVSDCPNHGSFPKEFNYCPFCAKLLEKRKVKLWYKVNINQDGTTNGGEIQWIGS